MKKRKIAVLIGLFACALLALGLAACQPEHWHTFSEEWAFDATHHWHEATCEHSEETEGKAEHTWNSGEVTTPATCTEAGEKTYTCTVCNSTKQQTIPATGHVWNDGEVTTPAGCLTDGITTYTCTVCDATKQQTIPATGHTFAEEWTADATHHWHAATCEHTEEKKDYAEHTYDENKVCTVCRTQYVSTGLEYTMSANGPHWAVSGIGTCTDTEIYIPATYQGLPVKEIGEHSFHENATITGVVLPDSITTINAHAFFCCTNLASINLPEGLTTIGEGAFNSVSIASIVIPAGVTTISDWAFTGCENLTTVYYAGTQEGWNAISVGRQNEPLINATKYYYSGSQPSTECYSWYFAEDGITPVAVEAHTIKEEWTFSDTHHWHETCEHKTSENGYGEHTYNENNVCTICGMDYVSAGLEYTLSGDSTYYTVSGIGTCTDTEIYIPATYNGLPVKEIGESAFYGKKTITGVVLPDGITTINAYAFYNCSSLASVTIPDSVTGIGSTAFYNCSGLASVTIGNGVTSIGGSAFSGCSGLTSVTIGNSVTGIGNYAFGGCGSLTSVTIPDSVTSIGVGAFSGCSGLASVTIGNGVTGTATLRLRVAAVWQASQFPTE